MRSHKLEMLLVFLLLLAPCARASGPGVHIRECDAVLDHLAAEDTEWAALAELPLARSYLRFGALSPDFKTASPSLGFGHNKDLSYHLLEVAPEDEPLLKLFALGHLCHQGSDGAMEALIVPTLFASAPVGIFSLYGEYMDGRGDSEGIVESFGDLVTGDWHGLVDTLFDFWFEDQLAKDRASAVFQWYCETGKAFLGKNTDCAVAQAELEAKLAKGDALIGLMDREKAHDFVDTLLSEPMVDLVDLATSGMLDALLAGELEPGPDYDQEVQRFKASPLVDPEFWALYEDLAGLGPALTLSLLELQPPAGSWPIYDPEAIICGNLQTIMNFLPEAYTVTPGLMVDRVQWRTEEGQELTELEEALIGSEIGVSLRLISSIEFQGSVIVRVRGDLPGLATDEDPILGEAVLELDLDPTQWYAVPRPELEVLFVPTGGILGCYVELLIEGSDKPFFTTSWDRLWFIDGLDLERPIYKNNFDTYGHWPPSLPRAEPPLAPAVILVKARVAPAGPGLAGATALLLSGDGSTELAQAQTAQNGLAILETESAGALQVELVAPGFAEVGSQQVVVAPNEKLWAEQALHAIPQPQAPAAWTQPSELPVMVPYEVFGGQVLEFVGQSFKADTDDPLGEPCSAAPGEDLVFDLSVDDGQVIRVRVVPVYTDETEGVEGWSEEVLLDASPPPLKVVVPEIYCEAPGPVFIVSKSEDPHSGLAELLWISEEGDETPIPMEPEVKVELSPDLFAARIRIRAINQAGGQAEIEIALQEEPDCATPEADPEPVAEPAPDLGPETPDATSETDTGVVESPESPAGGANGGGCGILCAPTPAGCLLWLLLLAGAMRTRRER